MVEEIERTRESGSDRLRMIEVVGVEFGFLGALCGLISTGSGVEGLEAFSSQEDPAFAWRLGLHEPSSRAMVPGSCGLLNWAEKGWLIQATFICSVERPRPESICSVMTWREVPIPTRLDFHRQILRLMGYSYPVQSIHLYG